MFRDPAAAVEPRIAPTPQLDRDAVAIGDLYRRGNKSIIDAARYHIECGRRLAAKKKALGYGRWLPWLAGNADALGGLTPRTAQLLMKAAANYEVDFAFDDLTVTQAKQINRQLWNNDIANAWVNSGNDEWYTCHRELDLVRAALGGTIDLDPASCPAAQRRVNAKRFFTKKDDGHKQRWLGTVFCNPPYSLIAEFTEKLISEYEAGRTTAAVMLTPANTSTKWFQTAGRAATAICFTNGRKLKFVNANGKEGNPAQGSAFFYFGHGQRRLQLFAQTFGNVGFIVETRMSQLEQTHHATASSAPAQH
jgi:hypothetical protein